MHSQEYVKTEDWPFAAYLMLNDYTYIATVDPENNTRRYEFYLTHSDPAIREDIVAHSNKLRDRLQGEDYDYIKYFKFIRKLRKSTYEETVVRKSTWEAKS